jgi:hypothetical protein
MERTMKRYVIERDLPGIGSLDREQLRDAAATFQESFVAGDTLSA